MWGSPAGVSQIRDVARVIRKCTIDWQLEKVSMSQRARATGMGTSGTLVNLGDLMCPAQGARRRDFPQTDIF